MLDNVSFSDFPSTIEFNKTMLAASVLSIFKSCQSKVMAHGFFQIKATSLNNQDKEIVPYNNSILPFEW